MRLLIKRKNIYQKLITHMFIKAWITDKSFFFVSTSELLHGKNHFARERILQHLPSNWAIYNMVRKLRTSHSIRHFENLQYIINDRVLAWLVDSSQRFSTDWGKQHKWLFVFIYEPLLSHGSHEVGIFLITCLVCLAIFH